MIQAVERHYTPDQVAELWHVSRRTVYRMFRDQPGVLAISLPSIRAAKKPRITLRISQSALERVYCNGAGGFPAEIKRGGRSVK